MSVFTNFLQVPVHSNGSHEQFHLKAWVLTVNGGVSEPTEDCVSRKRTPWFDALIVDENGMIAKVSCPYKIYSQLYKALSKFDGDVQIIMTDMKKLSLAGFRISAFEGVGYPDFFFTCTNTTAVGPDTTTPPGTVSHPLHPARVADSGRRVAFPWGYDVVRIVSVNNKMGSERPHVVYNCVCLDGYTRDFLMFAPKDPSTMPVHAAGDTVAFANFNKVSDQGGRISGTYSHALIIPAGKTMESQWKKIAQVKARAGSDVAVAQPTILPGMASFDDDAVSTTSEASKKRTRA